MIKLYKEALAVEGGQGEEEMNVFGKDLRGISGMALRLTTYGA